MYKRAARYIRRRLERAYEVLQERSYRKLLRQTGVRIDRDVHLFAIEGIRIGRGSIICQGATLAATDLTADRPMCPTDGEVVLGERCLIMPGAMLAASGGRIVLGNDVSVNPYTILYGAGGLTIGDNTRIAAHCVIVPSNHRFSDPLVPIMEQGLVCKGIRIGRDVWLGAGVRVLDGVSIGDGAIVGAGSVVTRDIEPFQIVAGVPARSIGQRGSIQHEI